MSITSPITLSVDVANNDVLVAQEFTHFQNFGSRSAWQGANHTFTQRDELALYRTMPRPSDEFKGTRKTAFKFTVDVQVDHPDGVSKVTSPIILEVSASVPLGAEDAEPGLLKEIRQRAIALLDDDALMDKVQLQCDISG